MTRDAVILSTWSWDTFNVPERLALALASIGSRVLYCDMPVSRFRQAKTSITQVEQGVYRLSPSYFGAKANIVPGMRKLQWRRVAREILRHAADLNLRNPLFIYSHVDGIDPLCDEFRKAKYPLIHVCMDYPEQYQYQLIEISDRTLVIPRAVFRELRAKYGEKVQWIPQSIHLPAQTSPDKSFAAEPVDMNAILRPRLGYLGPIFARLDLPMLREVLENNPDWNFVYFGESDDLLPNNAHSMKWRRPEELPRYVASLDAGILPYDCSDRKNLHCSPLKLYDYFLAGIPVAATPILELSEFSDLIYFGQNAADFASAVDCALKEPENSPKRRLRAEVAQAHSTAALGLRLEEVLGDVNIGLERSF